MARSFTEMTEVEPKEPPRNKILENSWPAPIGPIGVELAGQLEQHPLDQQDWQLYSPPPRTTESYVQILSPRPLFRLMHPRRFAGHESEDVRLLFIQ